MLWNNKPKLKKYQIENFFFFSFLLSLLLTPNSNLTNAQRMEKEHIGARSRRGEIVCEPCVFVRTWKLISSMETKPKHDR